MKQFNKILIFSLLCLLLDSASALAQTTLKGKVQDGETGEDLIGAAVALVQGGGGTITNYEGEFVLKVEALPVSLRISYTGYATQEIQVASAADRVLVKPADAEEKTKGGIIIPDTAKEKPMKGKVIAVGNGKKDEPMTVKAGDTVLYGKYAGTEITIDSDEYLIMRESDIFAIV